MMNKRAERARKGFDKWITSLPAIDVETHDGDDGESELAAQKYILAQFNTPKDIEALFHFSASLLDENIEKRRTRIGFDEWTKSLPDAGVGDPDVDYRDTIAAQRRVLAKRISPEDHDALYWFCASIIDHFALNRRTFKLPDGEPVYIKKEFS